MGESQNPNVFAVFYHLLQVRGIALSTQPTPQFLFHHVWKGQWVITLNAPQIVIQLL